MLPALIFTVSCCLLLMRRNYVLHKELHIKRPHAVSVWIREDADGPFRHLVINRGFDIYLDGKLLHDIAYPAMWSRSLSLHEVNHLHKTTCGYTFDDLTKELKRDCTVFYNLNTATDPKDN